MSTPNRSLSAAAADPNGAWSAISKRASPSLTQRCTDSISIAVNADGILAESDALSGTSASAFAITSTSKRARRYAEKGSWLDVNSHPSALSRVPKA